MKRQGNKITCFHRGGFGKMNGRKNFLKEAGVVLIISLLVLSSLMVTANTTNNGTKKSMTQTVLLDEDLARPI